jgi:hypothetical protein
LNCESCPAISISAFFFNKKITRKAIHVKFSQKIQIAYDKSIGTKIRSKKLPERFKITNFSQKIGGA